MDLHPFWMGFYGEVEKLGFVDPGVAAEYAAEHPVVAASAVGVPLGLAAIGAKRAIQRRMAAKAAPAAAAAAAAPKGFGLKGLAVAGGLGALGGYMMGKKKSEQ
jgi:hypothetical protein